MKLLVISTDTKIFEKGSAVAQRQIEYAKNFEELHIVVFDHGGDRNKKLETREIALAPNAWAYSTQSLLKFLSPFNATRLGRFIIEKRGITHITVQDPFLTALTGTSLKRQFPQVKLEIQLHTDIGAVHYPYSIGNKIRKTLALSYLPQADSIRVVSDRSKSYLVGTLGLPSEKIEVRPIPVDVVRIENAPVVEGADLHKKYPQFSKVVLMASRIEKEKNIGLAIDAWKEVIEKCPATGLVIVGSGSQKKQLQELVVTRGLVNSVKFEDWVSQKTLASYYKTADLFLLTSLFEGYGMTLVEAHAAGTKIISTDVGVAPEMHATLVDWKAGDVAAKIVYSLGI